jgi:hypothetical protein
MLPVLQSIFSLGLLFGTWNRSARVVPGSLLPLILGTSLLFLNGCQTATDRLDQKLKIGVPVVQVFFAKYEDVEAALKLAMLKYPQRVDNTEAGIFESDYVKSDGRFKPPHSAIEYSSGYRYRILIRLVRGKTDSRSAVKVVVLKQIETVHDFFSEPGTLPSDGLEEEVILYRIGRELTINKALQRAVEKQNKKDKSSGSESAPTS